MLRPNRPSAGKATCGVTLAEPTCGERGQAGPRGAREGHTPHALVLGQSLQHVLRGPWGLGAEVGQSTPWAWPSRHPPHGDTAHAPGRPDRRAGSLFRTNSSSVLPPP